MLVLSALTLPGSVGKDCENPTMAFTQEIQDILQSSDSQQTPKGITRSSVSQTSDDILEQSGSQTVGGAPVKIDVDRMMTDSEFKAKRELKVLEKERPEQKTLFKAAKTKYRNARKSLRQEYRDCKKQLRKTGLG